MMIGNLNNRLISEIGTREKYIRANHYNTLKVWWARRPITTCRSLLIQEVLKRNGVENKLIDIELFSEVNPSKKIFDKFKNEFKTNELSVLDVFSGGGAIPFESARLGFETYCAELNPVASLLQESIFNSQLIEKYPEKLRKAGYDIIGRVENRISKYFNINGTIPYVLFWSKVAKCKSCNSDLDLRRFEYLSKRVNKPLRILDNEGELSIATSLNSNDSLKKEFTCSKCNEPHSFKDIKDYCKENSFSFSPFAVCYHNNNKKSYKIISKDDKKVLDGFDDKITTEIEKLKCLIPDEKVKSKSGVINPTIYDLKTHKDFFSKRQLLVLLTVIDEVINEHQNLVNCYNHNDAKQITLGLTSLIEFLVDWNSVSTMWISQNEQTGRSLAGPGVGMKWDFIEVNPFYDKGSNLKSKIDRVCDTYSSIKFNNKVNIIKGSSTSLPLPENSIDIVLTDPPYYDSIDYTGLSEFFRPWFEILIKNTFDKNINLKNQTKFEAIVELSKSVGSKDHGHYKDIMTGVLKEVNRVLNINGTVLLMYSHKTIEGWQVIAEAFQESSLFITDCNPLEMERIARPRAMAYEALNGVIVFRAKKSNLNITSVQEDISSLKEKISNGVILESQVVIYLAGLACKQVTLTGKSFIDCYDEVTKIYQLTLIEKWMKEDMDSLTVAYLEAVLIEDFKNLGKEYLDLLNGYELIKNGKIKPFDEININPILNDTIFGKSQIIYNDFKRNSTTKVNIEERNKESITVFFSILAGTQLNTVLKRSNTIEVKTARLVLSKIV
jgi:putative DNA methylase